LHNLLRDTFNIPNTLIYIFIAIIFISIFLGYKEHIKTGSILLFISALAFFALAAFLDLLSDGRILPVKGNNLIEELFRIAGSLTWFSYSVNLYTKIRNRFLIKNEQAARQN
jgi:hypothetical protein